MEEKKKERGEGCKQKVGEHEKETNSWVVWIDTELPEARC